MAFIAVADIGGLGAREGPAILYPWRPPSILPSVLPWVAMLVLLAAPANRKRKALWLLLPLALLLLVVSWLPNAVQNDADELVDVVRPMAFGIAAIWSLSFLWVWKHRLLALVGSFLASAGMSVLVLVLDQSQSTMGLEVWMKALTVAVWALLLSASLVVAGIICRRQYRPGRVVASLMASCVALHVAAAIPFVLAAVIGQPGGIPGSAVLAIVLVPALASVGMLLPFLLLSFGNELYRERLQGMLRLAREPLPPMLKPDAAAAK